MTPVRFAIFRFVTHRFGNLRQFWILTQAFDFGLSIVTIATAPSVTSGISLLTKSLLLWPGVTLSRHKLGGRQFNWRGTELGHVHANGIVDLRFTATEQADVLTKGLASRHHIAPNSTWVTFLLLSRYDATLAEALFAIAYKRVNEPEPALIGSPSEEDVP